MQRYLALAKARAGSQHPLRAELRIGDLWSEIVILSTSVVYMLLRIEFLSKAMYTMGHKKGANLFLSVTSSKILRFECSFLCEIYK